MPPKKRIYRVSFVNEGKVYEVYAKSVSQGSLFGFVEIEGLLFGERSTVVVDPTEESLKIEFAGVERTYVPLHSIVRIDEVEKRGSARIHSIEDGEGKVRTLGKPIYTPATPEK